MNSPYPVRKGQEVEVEIETLAAGGRGVARVDGFTLFVDGGLPGQRVQATVVRRKRSFGEARLLRVLRPSPEQVDPPCLHFGTCGGCRLQHLAYASQLRAKQQHVRDALDRIAGLDGVPVEPVLPSPSPFAYRNKMEFSFSTRWLTPDEMAAGDDADPRFGLGLHVRRRFDRVVNVDRCHLISAEGSRVPDLVRELAQSTGLPIYDTRIHRGFWRHVVLRESERTGNRMVVLITHDARPGSREERAVDDLARALQTRGPRLTSLLHAQNRGKAQVAAFEGLRVLSGEAVLRERMLDLEFEISPESFFQTNTAGAEQLFRLAFRLADLDPGETVWDLYSGVGAISLGLARSVRQVIGLEIVPEAVAAAERNARINAVENARFVAGDVRRLLAERGASLDLPPPDTIVVDPPRDGLHADVIPALAAADPRRILYVSCNPASLARDLDRLRPHGYEPGVVHPVDLFPHTPHVECVVRLDRQAR